VLPCSSAPPLDQKAARHYGELRAFLQKQGTSIGSNDTLIAAEALAQVTTLITDNLREFSRGRDCGWRTGCANQWRSGTQCSDFVGRLWQSKRSLRQRKMRACFNDNYRSHVLFGSKGT